MYYIKKALTFIYTLGQRFLSFVESIPSNIRSHLLDALDGVPWEIYNYAYNHGFKQGNKAVEVIEQKHQECEHLREQNEALKQEIFELESYINLLVKQQEQ